MRPAFSTELGAVFNADCFDLFRALGGDTIDCVFADPPFNLGKDYGNGSAKDNLKATDYLDWCFEWIDECVRVLKPGGAIFVYNLPRWAYHLAAHLESREMTFRHWIAISMKSTFPRGRKLYPAHYALLYFTKGPPKTFSRPRTPVVKCRHCKKEIKDYGGYKHLLNPLGLNLTDFWEDTSPVRHAKFKVRRNMNELSPVIPARCIEMATQEGDLVLDPFGGGGSTFEAAQKLNRHWIGTEITDCGLIKERFQRIFPDLQSGIPTMLVDLISKQRASPHLGSSAVVVPSRPINVLV
jgi:site-specific DNA-methyltransferase (adenine-specific)